MRTAILLMAVAAGTPLLADDASRKAKAEELMTLMNVQQIQNQVFAAIKQASAQQMPKDATPEARKAVDDVMELMQKKISWENMKESFVSIYVETFTDEELDSIVGFYRSPGGKAMLAKMPVLMQKSMAVAQKTMQDIMPEIQKMTKDAIEKSKAK
jgi:hypothetical protein